MQTNKQNEASPFVLTLVGEEKFRSTELVDEALHARRAQAL